MNAGTPVARSKNIRIGDLLGESKNRRKAFEQQLDVLEAAALIREIRGRSKLSQEELAQKLGTHQSHISELERGNGAQGPTFTMLTRIARACNVGLNIRVGSVPPYYVYSVSSQPATRNASTPKAGDKKIEPTPPKPKVAKPMKRIK